MTTYTITAGYDTFISSTLPNANFKSSSVGQALSTVNYAFIYFPLSPDLIGEGTTVSSATLTLTAVGSLGSSSTFTVTPVSSDWSDSTVTYNRQPSVGTGVTTAVSSGATVFNLNVGTLMQAVSSGTDWYGFRVASTTLGVWGSFESSTPPVLTVVTTEAPDQPKSLVPNGTVVGSGAPILTCDFVDNGGLSNDMGAIQVQVDPAQNSASPAYDSGTVASTIPVFDLSAHSFTAISSGATTYWRVRVQDTSGLWSDWSDWVSFTYYPKPTITLLTPATGVLWDPTTTISATTSANMSAYRVQITESTDQTKVRFDTGRTAANPSALTTINVALPEDYNGTKILVDDRDYKLHIQAWDTHLDRQGTPGLPSYTESWTTFHFDNDLTVTAVSTLTADQLDASPAVTLTWTRASSPDAWMVYRDGKALKRLDPTDTIVGVSTWSWTDPRPAPWVEHSYQVAPITSGKAGDKGPTADIVPDSRAIWIYTQDGSSVAIDGKGIDQLARNSRLSTYKPVNLGYDVDIVTALEGLSGTISGTFPSAVVDELETGITDAYLDAKAVLDSIRENPGQSVRLIFGTFSGEVLIRNLSYTPHPDSNITAPLQMVSFGVNQVGDL